MEILQLVDQLEQVLNQGWRIPLTASLIVNEEECLRLIDQMRISVPSAIKESQRMIAERDRILAEAQAQADAILAQAQHDAAEMVNQHFIVAEARREAQRIVDLGHEEAMRLVHDAEEYALNVLQELVEQLTGSLQQAQNGIRAIEESRIADQRETPASAATPAPPQEEEEENDQD